MEHLQGVTRTEIVAGESQARSALLLLALLGGILSLALYLLVRDAEQQRLQMHFSHHVEHQASQVQAAIDQSLEVLSAVGGLMYATPTVDRHGYEQFVAQLLARHPAITAVHWAPRISHAQRPALEAELAARGLAPRGIFDVTPGAETATRAPQRDSYFPIVLAAPLAQNRAAVGLDPLARPFNTATIREAARRGLRDTTPAFPIVQDPDGPLAVAIYQPVYQPGAMPDTPAARWQALRGYVILMLRPEILLQNLPPWMFAAQTRVTLLDISGGTPQQIAPRRAEGPATAALIATGGMDMRMSLRVPGRQWQLLFQPDADLQDGQPSARALLLLLGGLLLTALVVWAVARTIRPSAEGESDQASRLSSGPKNS